MKDEGKTGAAHARSPRLVRTALRKISSYRYLVGNLLAGRSTRTDILRFHGLFCGPASRPVIAVAGRLGVFAYA
jgi:hypothetical protein